MTRTARFSLDGIVERDALVVAPSLLGAILSVLGPTTTASVRPAEVEVYLGEYDPGSHAFRGCIAWDSSMFKAGGRIYVYSIYDVHHCANTVCGPVESALAIFLHAGKVIRGVEAAKARRSRAQHDTYLTRGPARLCTAPGLTREDDVALLGEAGGRAGHDPPGPENGCHRPWRGRRRLPVALLDRRRPDGPRLPDRLSTDFMSRAGARGPTCTSRRLHA